MEDYRPKTTRNQTKSSDPYSVLERRMEKIEKSMSISDEVILIKKEQDENKQYEIDRRLDSLDNRLKRVEMTLGHFIIDLDDKIESHESQISLIKQIPVIKGELDDLKCSFYTDERIAALEKDLNIKMLKMFEMIEELTRNVSYKEKEIDRLKREISDLRSENEKYVGERDQQSLRIKELINQMEEIWRRQEMIDSVSSGQKMIADESLDEEELFLKKLRASGYTFQ